MTDIDRLKTVFLAFAAASGLSEATVSTRFLGSGRRWQKIVDGGDIGSKVIHRALVAFRAGWPKDHEIPECLTAAAYAAGGGVEPSSSCSAAGAPAGLDCAGGEASPPPAQAFSGGAA